MKKNIAVCKITNLVIVALCGVVPFAGCETTQQSAPVAAVQAPPLPQAAQAQAERPSNLSYGMVTGKVQKGVTTQYEIMELFGGPNTMTTDRDGTEVWMYDKTASTVTGAHSSSAAQSTQSEAHVMAAFLGIPLVAGVSGASATARTDSAQVSQAQSSVTRSVRNITFIIKFNDDEGKTVKDYSVRQSQY